MRVVCDNCGASYKIPDSKLVKEVNHATCRKCGHRIVISRREGPNTEPGVGEGGQAVPVGDCDAFGEDALTGSGIAHHALSSPGSGPWRWFRW